MFFYLEDVSKSLAFDLRNLIDKTKKVQIKLFGVIGASEESLIMMLSSAWLGAHHSICFEDLSEEAILNRIETVSYTHLTLPTSDLV